MDKGVHTWDASCPFRSCKHQSKGRMAQVEWALKNTKSHHKSLYLRDIRKLKHSKKHGELEG